MKFYLSVLESFLLFAYFSPLIYLMSGELTKYLPSVWLQPEEEIVNKVSYCFSTLGEFFLGYVWGLSPQF